MIMMWLWLACAKSVEPTVPEHNEAGVQEAPVSVSERAEPQVDMGALKSEGITVIQTFGSQLKPQLKSAMAEGGTVQAIAVCAEQAPTIARSVTESTGWNVKRVSLKTRNDETAMPDDWERQTLEWFDAQVASGVDASTLVKAEVVDDTFRMMKAQPVEGICLACHGSVLSPGTESALNAHYPNDVARGYELGQVRGAFSIQKKLE